MSENEGPCWEDAWDLYDLTKFNELDESDTFFDRYTSHSGTKIGGWPSFIQGSPGAKDYVFQIGSEEKANWAWGDAGTGYFFLRDGEWFLDWDCC
jgi:uncharacterized protein YwqG